MECIAIIQLHLQQRGAPQINIANHLEANYYSLQVHQITLHFKHMDRVLCHLEAQFLLVYNKQKNKIFRF